MAILLYVCAFDDLSRQNHYPGAAIAIDARPTQFPLHPNVCLGAKTILQCQRKMQSNGRAKTNAKVYRLPPRRANSCAKKWNIFVKANMARARLSRRSPSVCRRRGRLE